MSWFFNLFQPCKLPSSLTPVPHSLQMGMSSAFGIWAPHETSGTFVSAQCQSGWGHRGSSFQCSELCWVWSADTNLSGSWGDISPILSRTRRAHLLFHCVGDVTATRIKPKHQAGTTSRAMSACAVTKEGYGGGLLHWSHGNLEHSSSDLQQPSPAAGSAGKVGREQRGMEWRVCKSPGIWGEGFQAVAWYTACLR